MNQNELSHKLPKSTSIVHSASTLRDETQFMLNVFVMQVMNRYDADRDTAEAAVYAALDFTLATHKQNKRSPLRLSTERMHRK